MSNWLTKLAVTLLALGLVFLRVVRPETNLDAVTLGLLAIAMLPWLSSIIDTVELPGGWKIKLRDVQSAGEKIELRGMKIASLPTPSPIEVSSQDPNLALVGLRIEIEKRLKVMADQSKLDSRLPVSRLSRELQRAGVLNGSTVSGLDELVMLGNRAAHGASVDPNAAAWAAVVGPQILAALDHEMETTGQAASASSQV